MPVCFATPKYLVNTVPSHVHEAEDRMYDIIDAIEAGDLLRIRQLIYFGDRTENEINQDEAIVVLESMNLNKFDFLVAFLAQASDINTTIYAVQKAVEIDNFEALEMLLQNDPGNELRGLAVIHTAHGNGTVECLNRLLQNHQIPEADLDQAIDEASYYDMKEVLEKYENEKND